MHFVDPRPGSKPKDQGSSGKVQPDQKSCPFVLFRPGLSRQGSMRLPAMRDGAVIVMLPREA